MRIKDNLVAIKNRIAVYERQYGRNQGSVQLLAASKGQSIEKIRAAYEHGVRAFGENYVQEALKKMAALTDLNDIEWHFLGPIQHNKTRKIAEHFDWAHSVADIKAARRLNDQRPLHLPILNICIEVNISHENTKAGVTAETILPLVEYCLSLPRIKLRGLMAIPAPSHSFDIQRRAFHTLYSLWSELREKGFALDTLSMGMSNDFEAAIAEGSTCIRIGSALFGQRGPTPHILP